MPRNVRPLVVKTFGNKIQTADLGPDGPPRSSLLKFKGPGRLQKERNECAGLKSTAKICKEKNHLIGKNHSDRALALLCARIDAHHIATESHRGLQAIWSRSLHDHLELGLEPGTVPERNHRSLE